MEPKLSYIIYLIAVLILVAPAFLASNTNTKVLFKNLPITSHQKAQTNEIENRTVSAHHC